MAARRAAVEYERTERQRESERRKEEAASAQDKAASGARGVMFRRIGLLRLPSTDRTKGPLTFYEPAGFRLSVRFTN